MSSGIDTIVYLSNVMNYMAIYFGLFIIIITTIGNLCDIVIFMCIPALNKHPNALFVIGSSIGSLIFVNTGLIPSVISVLTGIDLLNKWLIWCKLNSWITYSAGCFSFTCQCFAAFGQFLITLPQVKWQRLITRRQAEIMISFTAIFWLLIFLPLGIYYHHIQTSSSTSICTVSTFINTYRTYFIAVGYYFLPILFILILFGLTWYNLRQLLRRRRSLEGSVTRMMLIQMCVILISGIPAGVCIAYILAVRNVPKIS